MKVCEKCIYYGDGDWAQCESCRKDDRLEHLEAQLKKLKRKQKRLVDHGD